MTEQEWLTSKDPYFMYLGLQHNRFYVSDRKWRLFCCACLRLCEKTANWQTIKWFSDWEDGQPIGAESRHQLENTVTSWFEARYYNEHKAVLANLLREMIGNPWQPFIVLPRDLHIVLKRGVNKYRQENVIPSDWLTPTVSSLAQAVYEKSSKWVKKWTCNEQGKHAHRGRIGTTIHGIFHTCVPTLPHHHHDNRCSFVMETDGTLDQERMGILADALVEAGCTGKKCPTCKGTGEYKQDHPFGETWVTETLTCHDCEGTGEWPHPFVEHLLSPGPHVRGCWVLDSLLGKE